MYKYANYPYRTLRIVFSVFLASPALVLYAANKNATERSWDFTVFTLPQFFPLYLAIAAVFAAIAAFLIPNYILKSQLPQALQRPWDQNFFESLRPNLSPTELSSLKTISEQEKKLIKAIPAFFVYYVLRFTLLESISMMGFVITTSTHNLYHMLPFVLVTYFGLVLSLPSIGTCEEKIQLYA
ncbi:MAG: hypothetical protein H6623_06375 [Bdellovibrionaceae bacterium]|nr:hypothetical protein [Pseudobdellovibrionaceae bacterium]